MHASIADGMAARAASSSGFGWPVGEAMARIARVWSEAARDPAAFRNAANGTGREAIIDIAERLGVNVQQHDAPVENMRSDDCPCVLLTPAGLGMIVLALPEKGKLLLDTPQGQRLVPIVDIADETSGLRVELRPKPVSLMEATYGQSAGKQPVERQGIFATWSDPLIGAVKALTLQEQRPLVAQLIGTALLSNLFSLVLPVFTMTVYDRVVPHMALETLWALAIGVLIALSLDMSMRYVRLKIQDAISAGANITLQARLYRRLLQARLVDAPRTAGGLSGTLRELDALAQLVPAIAIGLMVDVPFFALSMALMVAFGGWVVFAPLIGMVAIIGLYAYTHHKAHDANIETTRYMGEQSNILIETIESLEAAKAASAEQRLMDRFESVTDNSTYAGHQMRLWSNLASQGTMTISQLVIVAMIVIGVYMIGNGALSVGALTACTMLTSRSMGPMAQLAGQIHRLVHINAIARPVKRLLSLPPEQGGDRGREAGGRITWALSATNVSFAYPGDAAPTLQGISLTIAPGERIAIIGKTGSGKTTLLRLLTRFHDVASGAILLDGTDIRQYEPKALRRSMGFMRQDPVLFDDTLRANICYGVETIDEVQFDQAVTLSGVKLFASRHPQGYGLRVGPRGERLSGGQRQAVMLARVIMQNPSLLVLDEPTASMDATLENAVINDLEKMLGNRTLIVATHRTPVLRIVDRVIWVEDGKIILDGPKNDVLRRLSGAAA